MKVFLLHLPILAFPWFNYFKAGGGIGVQFFFVLSGFLITYIICVEKKETGKLNLRNFFARRILRIWPLYYLMVAGAYLTPYLLAHFTNLTSSPEGYEPKLCISVLFLENYKMMFTHQHPSLSPLGIMWTLCIEEHFYIIWGLLLYYMPIKKLPTLIITCLLLSPLCRAIYVHYNIPTSDIFTNIDLFAYGAIPAYFLIQYPEQLENKINTISYPVKALFLILLLTAVAIASQFTYSEQAFVLLTALMGILFCLLIFLILPEQNRIKINDRNILSRLGIYTYGLYLYHILVINLLKQVYMKKGWDVNTSPGAISFSFVALLLTIFCSILSYHLFEKHFLKLKKYFRK